MSNPLDRMSLSNRVAIVTGGGGGIGKAYSRALAECGASVVIADINGEAAEKAAKELSADGLTTDSVTLDVSDLSSAEAAVAHTVSRFGGLDILVNNAGIMSAIPKGSLLVIPIEKVQQALTVNAVSMLICARAAVPAMLERGAGRIINQSSTAAFLGGSLYRWSKHAVFGLTASLAKELGPQNITVNGIAPGMIQTEESFRSAGEPGSERRNVMAQMIPNPVPDRQPEALIGALLLLASDAGDYVNGQTLIVDGGLSMRL